MVAPMIEAARADHRLVGSGFLYLVVMNPALAPGDAPFEAAILHERSFGNEAQWDADYRRFARDKARLSWLRGMDGHAIQALAPQLLRAGDASVAGGIWLDGIVVAASGAFPWYDEVFAGAVALALRAAAKEAHGAAK
jgi:hypothetical protein